MGQRSRIAVLVAVAVAASAAFVLVRPGSGTRPAGGGPVHVRVVGGAPAGGVRVIRVVKGARARFSVTSDVSDEIHVHGYDLKREVAAGHTVAFDFPATIDGIFVVELERRGRQIASLRVQP